MAVDWLDPWVVLLMATLYNVGKAGAHATRDRKWARRPLISGLPISDAYHAFSGLEWAAVVPYCWVAWAASWMWALAAVIWGAVWPLSKRLKYPTMSWPDIMREAWYVQAATLIWRYLRWAS